MTAFFQERKRKTHATVFGISCELVANIWGERERNFFLKFTQFVVFERVREREKERERGREKQRKVGIVPSP